MNRALIVSIMGTGACLLISCIALCFMVMNSTHETIENRKVACIGRYLDGRAMVPQCKEYIDGLK